MKRNFLALAFIMISIGAFANCTMIEVPLSQRAASSSDIVEGKVVDQYSYWNTAHNMIYTSNVIELYKVFKGNLTSEKIEVLTVGGTVGFDRIIAEPSLKLNIGDFGMFTLSPVTRYPYDQISRNGLMRFEVYASLQGFIKYDLVHHTASEPFRTYVNIRSEVYDAVGSVTNRSGLYLEIKPIDKNQLRTVQPSNQSPTAGPNVDNFSPINVTSGTGTVLTINGTSFGNTQGSSFVSFPNADDGGATFIQPLPSQYISWSDTQIRVEVPTAAGTGQFEVNTGTTATSPSILTVDYAHLNVDFDPGSGTVAYQTDHVNDNGTGGYTWRMNTAFDADASASASFMRAFDTWRCNTGVNWTIGATTSINDAVSDGTNVICFDNTAPLSSGILGVCYSYWSGCSVGPTIVWYVSELDIIFDEGSNIAPQTWQYGPSLPAINEYDFETVAVHELGHGHQLGHVIDPGAIMHYAIGNGSSNRSLGVNDDAGGTFVQGKSTTPNVCGPGGMSNYICGSPPVAAFTGAPLTICAGQTVNFTDQSTGSPTGWTWTLNGGTPSSSSSQNPSIIYNTPGTYAVTLNVSNGSGSDSHTELAYITVNAGPTVTASSNPAPATVCSGQSVTLTAGGDAVSYSWSGGITDGVPFIPGSTQTYTVTGTAANGCTSTATSAVTVNSNPTLSISSNPSNGIVCSGNQATLTASGAQSYSWTGGITNAVSFVPASTTTYTVTGTSAAGCTATAQQTITVQNCSGPVTTVPCGLVVMNRASSASAVNVPGATQYRFTFYNNVTLQQVAQVTQTSRTLTFTNVTSSAVFYGNTYRWTVAVNTGSGFGSESSIGCTITFGVPQTTVQCGKTFNGFAGYTTAAPIAGVTNYIFRFYDNVTLALVATRTQPSNYIYFNQVPGLQYGTTYRWTVQLQYNSAPSTPAFGPESSNSCTITFGALSTTVPCGKTYNYANGYTTAAPVSGALGYRFTFYQNSVQVAQVAQGSNYIYFNQVPGLANNNLYQWTVEVLYNSGSGPVYGPPSSPCNCTLGTPPPMAFDPNLNYRVADSTLLEPAPALQVSMYPNPLSESQNPVVTINGADGQVANVNVFDLNGRLITTYEFYVEGDVFSTELSGFPALESGMYLMEVKAGDASTVTKFIAE